MGAPPRSAGRPPHAPRAVVVAGVYQLAPLAPGHPPPLVPRPAPREVSGGRPGRIVRIASIPAPPHVRPGRIHELEQPERARAPVRRARAVRGLPQRLTREPAAPRTPVHLRAPCRSPARPRGARRARCARPGTDAGFGSPSCVIVASQLSSPACFSTHRGEQADGAGRLHVRGDPAAPAGPAIVGVHPLDPVRLDGRPRVLVQRGDQGLRVADAAPHDGAPVDDDRPPAGLVFDLHASTSGRERRANGVYFRERPAPICQRPARRAARLGHRGGSGGGGRVFVAPTALTAGGGGDLAVK